MSDQAIFHEFQAADEAVAPPDGCWTNFLGLHTRADWFQAAEPFRGKVRPEIPVPNDGVYGWSTEYMSMLTAIKGRLGDRRRFSAVELGAGWGPWISAVGVVCKRLGFERIDLVGVEAESTKHILMGEHMAVNGLMEDSVHVRLIRGAAWSEDTTLHFPKAMPVHDYGGAATTEKSDTDYRGVAYETEEVPAYSLETICDGLDMVDYAHWDVQGAEWPIALSSREFMNARVRHLFIGTHSRQIEGNLLGLFHDLGWDVLQHNPCAYVYDRTKRNLEAMTTTDGDLFVRNPNLA